MRNKMILNMNMLIYSFFTSHFNLTCSFMDSVAIFPLLKETNK